LGILFSSILSRWPNQLILCPFIHFTIFNVTSLLFLIVVNYYQSTLCSIPQDLNFHQHCSQNVKIDIANTITTLFHMRCSRFVNQ
jgi:hypothetical protein